MVKNIIDIIQEDKAAGYKVVNICGRCCENCAYASETQDFRPRGHESFWGDGFLERYAKSHNGLEKWCSQTGQWMREEYWKNKQNCENYQPKDFKKERRVVISLRRIWK